MNSLVVLLALAGTLASCSHAERQVKSPYPAGYFEKQIAALTQADAEVDVANAVAKGDRRFLLNVGFGGSVPGVTNWSAEMREKYGTRILDGTGDMVFGPKHEEFKKVADGYAERYNQLLLKEIGKAENRPIGIGSPIAEAPSLTTGRTDRVSGGYQHLQRQRSPKR